MDIGVVDYASIVPPPKYSCSKCKVHGVALFRQYQCYANYIELLCVDCAEKDQDKKFNPDNRPKCSEIGWLVAAVPTAEGDTYWGYTSVPQDGCDWWYRLPKKLEVKNEQ